MNTEARRLNEQIRDAVTVLLACKVPPRSPLWKAVDNQLAVLTRKLSA